jgi:DNA-binding sugar fermentation-stimulating protein
MTTLYQLDNLLEAIVVARPSKSIKSPYVADIIVSSTGENALAHTPALGCCGLSDKTSKILVAKSKSKDSKCDYVVYCSIVEYTRETRSSENEGFSHIFRSSTKENDGKQIVVGIHPKMAETIVENALKQNCLSTLQNVQSYRREQTVISGSFKSRFDFTGIDQVGCPFIMEVKSVPLCLPNGDGTNAAFFPDGYRKKKGDVVSPRALKHIQELESIKMETSSRCIMCYVIQRSDVVKFQTATTDPEYKAAVKKAHENGVEIITLCIDWSKAGTATFVCCDLPFEL